MFAEWRRRQEKRRGDATKTLLEGALRGDVRGKDRSRSIPRKFSTIAVHEKTKQRDLDPSAWDDTTKRSSNNGRSQPAGRGRDHRSSPFLKRNPPRIDVVFLTAIRPQDHMSPSSPIESSHHTQTNGEMKRMAAVLRCDGTTTTRKTDNNSSYEITNRCTPEILN